MIKITDIFNSLEPSSIVLKSKNLIYNGRKVSI